MERTVERELIPLAKGLNIGVLAWSSLASGMLNGKYHDGRQAEGARLSQAMMRDFIPEEQRATRVVSAVKIVSEQLGRSMAQVALAWLRYRPVPVIPIIGARKASQLQDNLVSLDVELSQEQLKGLDEASRVDLGFPHSIYNKDFPAGLRYGGMWDRLLVQILASSRKSMQTFNDVWFPRTS